AEEFGEVAPHRRRGGRIGRAEVDDEQGGIGGRGHPPIVAEARARLRYASAIGPIGGPSHSPVIHCRATNFAAWLIFGRSPPGARHATPSAPRPALVARLR